MGEYAERDARMNFLHAISPTSVALAAHARLAGSLTTHSHVVPPEEDGELDEFPATGPIEAQVTSSRFYRPKGKVLAMIRALRVNGPMTVPALSRVADCESRQLTSLLKIAVSAGLCQRRVGPPARWEAL